MIQKYYQPKDLSFLVKTSAHRASAKSLFLSFEYGVMPNEFKSPLKQMRSGTDAGDVICNEGLELFMKKSNGKAVCLSESTADILLQRGVVDFF